MRGWPVSPIGATSFNYYHRRKPGAIESMTYELLMMSGAEMSILKNFNQNAYLQHIRHCNAKNVRVRCARYVDRAHSRAG